MKKIAVVGGGVAAMSAAVYALRGNADVTMFAPYGLGGLVATIDKINNFPSYTSVDGWTLSQNFAAQVKSLGLKPVSERVISVTQKDDKFAVVTDKNEYVFDRVIVASGTSHNKLGFETQWVGKGVSYCATCDGNFYKNKVVSVVGGGSQAVREALYLANLAERVIVLAGGSVLTCDAVSANQIDSLPNVSVVYNATPTEISGSEIVDGIVYYVDGERVCAEVSAVFVAVGQTPNSDFVHIDDVKDEKGYIKVDGRCETSVKGLFAAGDVTDGALKQIVTACGDGAKAGLFALK